MTSPARESGTGKFVATVTLDADIARFMRGINDAASRMQSAGASFAASTAKMAAGAAALAGGFAVKEIVGGGMAYNAMMEESQNRIAATLRLYKHLSPEVDATASAAEQFAGNLREATAVQKRLVTIADESPGAYDQVSRMFQSMLPSARAITGDMERIMDLTQKTTLFAGVTGDFDLAGSQMGMMLGGAAGQEMQMWRLLKPTIQTMLEADKKLKAGAGSADVAKAFNQALTPAQRLDYIMNSLSSLGPEVAEHFGKSWEGATSQAKSRVKELMGIATKGLYELTKDWLVTSTSGEDFLSSKGGGFQELKEAARYAGDYLEEGGRRFFNGLSKVISWSIENWEYIAHSLERGFSTGLAAAKLFVAAKLTGGVAGGFYNLGKSMVETGRKVPGFIKHLQSAYQDLPAVRNRDNLLPPSLANTIEAIGRSSFMALPALGLMALALGGIAVVVGGVVAAIIQDWDKVLNDLATGKATLDPILDVIDLLWVKFVAVGRVFLGTNSAVDMTNGAILGVAGALTTLMGFFSSMIRVTAYFSMALGGLYNTLQLIAIAFNLVVTGILAGVKWLLDSVNSWIDSEALASASSQTGYALAELEQDRNRRVESLDMTTTRSLFEAADAFDAAAVEGAGITAGLREELNGALAKLGKGEGGSMTAAKGKHTTIHNLHMYNDFRDGDPDRVMGTFVQKLEDITMRPTQAVTLDDNGA